MDTPMDKEHELWLAAKQIPATNIMYDSIPIISETQANPPASIMVGEILSTFPLTENIIDLSKKEDLVTELSVKDIPINSSNMKDKIMEFFSKSRRINYKEDQWTPLNPSGKRQYSREYLLYLQCHPMCLCKPKNLPNLNVIKDKAHIQKLPMQVLYKNGKKNPNKTAKKKIAERGKKQNILQPTEETVKLHKSANAWLPSYKMEDTADQKLYKKVRGILNQLTLKNFDTLIKQVKKLHIDTEEKLNGVIDVVIEQFIKEAIFRNLYAKICEHLALICVPLDGKPGQVEFRQLLIRKLEQEGNKLCKEKIKANGTADLEVGKQLQMEIEEERRKIWRRKLGNIMFISELFKVNMISEPIMHEYIKQLLLHGDEESLECLCCMLIRIGKELDMKGNKNTEDSCTPMDEYFSQMRNLMSRKLTSLRIHFKLQDVIDIRQNNWLSQSEENNFQTTLDLSIPIIAGGEETSIPPSTPHDQQGNKKKTKKKKEINKKKNFMFLNKTNIQLHASKNPWRQSYKMEVVAESQKLCRKFRSILNKLTNQNFDILVKQLQNLVINTEEKLNAATDVVIEQFTKEAIYRELYAKLCDYLALICVPTDGKPEQVEFRQLLITKCLIGLKQERNNKLQTEKRIKAIGAVDLEIGKQLQMEFEEEEQKILRRILGNIMFISELFKLNMLSEPIVHECIKQLVLNGDDESLECLCCMLEKIGKELDEKRKNNSENPCTPMNEYFAQMQNIILRKLACLRICFKLQDVIDMRQNNWVSKKEGNDP